MKAREEEGMGEYDQGVLKEGRGNDVFRNETSARIEKGWSEGEGVERREKKLEKLRAPNFCN